MLRGIRKEMTPESWLLKPPTPTWTWYEASLPNPGPQQQISTTLHSEASLQEHLERVPLPSQAVHHIRAGLDERSLQHVAQKGEDRVEGIKLGLASSDILVLDSGQELSEDGKVEDQRSGQERVLALVEDIDGRATTAEDFGVVLIDRALGVTDRGNVFDDDDVVGVFALGLLALGSRDRRLVEQAVGVNHVVDDAALRNLLRLELGLGGKIASVVVTEMVVGGDGERLDASVHQELGEDGLELGLTRLKIVTSNEGTVALRKLNGARNKSILGSSVDEGLALENSGNSEEGRWGNLGMGVFDRVQEVVRSVVHTGDDVTVSLGVGGPKDDDTFQVIGGPELADVRTELLEVGLLVTSGDDIVCTSLLVGGNEVRIVDRGKGFAQVSHVAGKLALEIPRENLSTSHSLVEWQARDIPSAEDEVIGVDHGQHVTKRNINILASDGVNSQTDRGSTEDRSNVVGLLNAGLCMPDNVVTVGEDGSGEGRAVISSNANHHQPVRQNAGYQYKFDSIYRRAEVRTQSLRPFARSGTRRT